MANSPWTELSDEGRAVLGQSYAPRLTGWRGVMMGAAIACVWLVAWDTPVQAQQAEPRPRHDEQCFTGAEARELVNNRVVTPPGPAIRKAKAAGGPGSRALRAHLCRRDGQYYYKVTLLKRDGKVVRQVASARPSAPR